MMRSLFMMALFLGSLSSTVQAQEEHGVAMDAMVTLHIGGLNDAGWARINAQVHKERNINVEYVCLRTGVVVLRMQPVQVQEKADVMAIVKRVLRDAGWRGPVEFLDIHVEQHGGSKC